MDGKRFIDWNTSFAMRYACAPLLVATLNAPRPMRRKRSRINERAARPIRPIASCQPLHRRSSRGSKRRQHASSGIQRRPRTRESRPRPADRSPGARKLAIRMGADADGQRRSRERLGRCAARSAAAGTFARSHWRPCRRNQRPDRSRPRPQRSLRALSSRRARHPSRSPGMRLAASVAP
jgi:hypothetical protein